MHRRAAFKLGVNWQSFYANNAKFREMTPAQRHHAYRELQESYYAYRNAKVDAFLQAEHEQERAKYVRHIAALETQLAKLWELVPEAVRPTVEVFIRDKMAEYRRWWAALLGGLRVVPEMSRRRENSGTTEAATVEPYCGA